MAATCTRMLSCTPLEFSPPIFSLRSYTSKMVAMGLRRVQWFCIQKEAFFTNPLEVRKNRRMMTAMQFIGSCCCWNGGLFLPTTPSTGVPGVQGTLQMSPSACEKE